MGKKKEVDGGLERKSDLIGTTSTFLKPPLHPTGAAAPMGVPLSLQQLPSAIGPGMALAVVVGVLVLISKTRVSHFYPTGT